MHTIIPNGFIGWTDFCRKSGKAFIAHPVAFQKLVESGDAEMSNGCQIVKETAEWPKRSIGWKAAAKLARQGKP